MTFADHIIQFNQSLHLDATLPEGVEVMNPFKERPHVLDISTQFYRKFYSDNQSRKLILGINPGRLGAGATGIPFTDTKRLASHCGLEIEGLHLHEPSSVFVYEVIDAFGGPEAFYNSFYINSVCPLGFVKPSKSGKMVNYNYYDDPALQEAVTPFILETLKTQIDFGVETQTVYCLGQGKNARFLQKLNEIHGLFGRVVALPHPRYVMQYKAKQKDQYVNDYIKMLTGTD